MGTVTAYTKEHMDDLIDSMIASGAVVGGELILTRYDGTTFDAGSIIGPWTTSIAVATSTTRPGSPYTGLGLFETDTKRFYIYDGAAWVYRGGLWICTAATRPASPFTGLMIYETDTKRVYIYDGAAWVYNGAIFVCTAATRPASPFAGLEIYETDTKRFMVYNGTAWTGVRPVRFLQAATGAAGFTAETTQATLVVPDQGCAGTLDLIGSCRIDKSAPTDDFRLYVKDGASIIGQGLTASAAVSHVMALGEVAMVAGSGKTITMTVARNAGGGTATTYTDGSIAKLKAVFTPSA